MPTNPNNGGGRPRTFENADMFQATTHVLINAGYAGLTLEAVAREAGCSAPAISKRFGSKRGLIQAYLEWANRRTAERFEACRRQHASPIAALRARYRIPVEERLEELGVFSGWREMRVDPDLAPSVHARTRLWQTEIAASLEAAREAGELVECDTVGLARTLYAALAGVTMLWSGDNDPPLIERISTVFDTVMDPYRSRRPA